MTRLTIGTLLGLAAATAVAWQLGGALGTGVLVGFVFGAGLTGLGIAWQAHVGRTRPERALRALAESFGAKLACLLTGALVLRYVEPAAVRADHRAFLVSFAVTAVLLLLLGAPEAARGLRARTAVPGSGSIDGDPLA